MEYHCFHSKIVYDIYHDINLQMHLVTYSAHSMTSLSCNEGDQKCKRFQMYSRDDSQSIVEMFMPSVDSRDNSNSLHLSNQKQKSSNMTISNFVRIKVIYPTSTPIR